MKNETKKLLDAFQRENNFTIKAKERKIKEKFSEFLDEVVNETTPVEKVIKLINQAVKTPDPEYGF